MRRILIISVNANAKGRTKWALERAAPSLSEVIGSVTADPISRYSHDTIDIVRIAFRRWAKAVSTPERRFLNDIHTNFNLTDEQVDRLISASREVLRESTEFKAFIKRNK